MQETYLLHFEVAAWHYAVIEAIISKTSIYFSISWIHTLVLLLNLAPKMCQLYTPKIFHAKADIFFNQ